VVAGKDVVRTREPDVAPSAPISLGGVDLSLSAEHRTLGRGLSMSRVRPFVAGLYALPLLLLGGALWRRRTRAQRDVGRESRAGVRAFEQAVAEARTQPAKEAAPRVARALAELARQLNVPASSHRALAEKLETDAFDPRAADQPLASARLDEILALARSWGKTPRGNLSQVATLLLLALAAGAVHADTQTDLATARDSYRSALGEKDRDRRTHAFAAAESGFRELVKAYPDRPELLADWGNAAVGAEDLGPAALAYRRALRLSPGLSRARSNLAWVRKQLPSWVPQAREGGAAESLFFWHQFLSRPERQLAAGAFFALAIVAFALGLDRRLLRRLSLLPLAAWAILLLSLAIERDVSQDAVLTGEAVTLRSADSVGAPAVFDKPLPAGTECTILEKRESWLRVQLADGATIGWVTAGSLEPIIPPLIDD
jgi:hypothetical protein